MRARYAVSLAMLAGFGLGVLVVQGLHAQARPPAYTIAEIEVTDQPGYQKYIAETTNAVPAGGGRFIVRGGRNFVVNGEPPKRVAVIQWESYEKAQAYFESEAYKRLIPMRDSTSKSRLFVIEGVSN
jgi:uncharacterized protein (DUF1330 family)